MSRELDALVAEKVFGLETAWVGGTDIPKIPLLVADLQAPASYTSDPSADYEVLKHVRETWDWLMQDAFTACLGTIWAMRGYGETKRMNFAMRYEPGDYARAALKTLGEAVG